MIAGLLHIVVILFVGHLPNYSPPLSRIPSGFFVGEGLTGADIMLSFPAEAAVKSGLAADKPKLTRYVAEIHSRPAYQAALSKGGPYAYA